MAVAAFLTAALESALDNEVATPEDILRHVTPDVLAAHVPRPVWARLISVCLAAPSVDAQLVVETIGVGTLCEHVPSGIVWACLTEIAMRTLGRGLVAAPPSVVGASAPPPASPVTRAPTAPVVAPPPVAAVAPVTPPPSVPRVATPPHGTQLRPPTNGGAPAVPPPDAAAEVTRVAHPPADLSRIAAEKSEMRGELTRVVTAPREPEPLGEPPAPPRAPGATSRGGASTIGARRPQASAAAPAATGTSPGAKAPRSTPPSPRRATTATDFEIETDVGEAWKRPAATPPPVEVVDEDQFIDWTSSEETATSGDKYGDRKPR